MPSELESKVFYRVLGTLRRGANALNWIKERIVPTPRYCPCVFHLFTFLVAVLRHFKM